LDGSGKSTHIKLFANRLKQLGIKCHTTFEPTYSPVGSVIRQILTGRIAADNRVIASLFAADRLDHLLNDIDGIRKKIDDGFIVLCDRYCFSSYAYQSVDVPLDWVINANALCADILRPACTVFIDITPDEAINRIKTERQIFELFETKERLTSVREKYFNVFDMFKDTESVVVVDGGRDMQTVSDEIWSKLSYLFN